MIVIAINARNYHDNYRVFLSPYCPSLLPGRHIGKEIQHWGLWWRHDKIKAFLKASERRFVCAALIKAAGLNSKQVPCCCSVGLRDNDCIPACVTSIIRKVHTGLGIEPRTRPLNRLHLPIASTAAAESSHPVAFSLFKGQLQIRPLIINFSTTASTRRARSWLQGEGRLSSAACAHVHV